MIRVNTKSADAVDTDFIRNQFDDQMKMGLFRTGICRVTAGMLLVIGLSSPALADEHESVWRLRLDLALIDPMGDLPWTSGAGASEVARFNSGIGFGLRTEYRFGYLFGVELGVLNTDRIDLARSSLGAIAGRPLGISSVTPVTIGLNFHLTPEHPIDTYIGLHLAWVNYGDITVSNGPGVPPTRVAIDRDIGWGLIVGAGIPLPAHGWVIHGSLRYMDARISGQGGGHTIDSNLDPLTLSVGLGYRF